MARDCDNVELRPGDEVTILARVTDLANHDAGLASVSLVDREGDVIHSPLNLPSRALKLSRRRDAGARQQ